MALNIDYTVNKLIQEIQNRFKNEDGSRLEYGTIVAVIESQLKATRDGMGEGRSISWKYLGTFLITDKRMKALNNRYLKIGKVPTLKDCGWVDKVIIFKKKREVPYIRLEDVA